MVKSWSSECSPWKTWPPVRPYVSSRSRGVSTAVATIRCSRFGAYSEIVSDDARRAISSRRSVQVPFFKSYGAYWAPNRHHVRTGRSQRRDRRASGWSRRSTAAARGRRISRHRRRARARRSRSRCGCGRTSASRGFSPAASGRQGPKLREAGKREVDHRRRCRSSGSSRCSRGIRDRARPDR